LQSFKDIGILRKSKLEGGRKRGREEERKKGREAERKRGSEGGGREK